MIARFLPCLGSLLMLANLTAAQAPERWVYVPLNCQVDAEISRVSALMKRSKAAGYTHLLLADSKFSRLGDVIDRYHQNAATIKREAEQLGLQLIPAIFPIGYSNNLLYHDPNLAEGLPVKDAVFVVNAGVARHLADPTVRLRDGNMNDRKAWAFVDESLVADDGAMRSTAPQSNSRLAHRLTVVPFRQYHVSVSIRTRGFKGGTAEIKAIAADGTQLQWTNLGVKPDQEWTTHHVTFNSLASTEITLYFGVWGGHQGDLWWENAAIEECGMVNLLRRPGTPLVVRRENGQVLKEGVDFEPVRDPLLGTTPWAGEYTAWHNPPDLHTKGLADGTRLQVSYFHPHIIYDGQVCACPSEPTTMELLKDQARRVQALWQPETYMMSHDEWRVLGWDRACQSRQLTPGQLVADNVRQCTKILRAAAPRGRIAVWNDMFDPHHNALDRYYLVNGSLANSWVGLDPATVIVNWNSGHAAESLRFFAKRGHQQIIAGY